MNYKYVINENLDTIIAAFNLLLNKNITNIKCLHNNITNRCCGSSTKGIPSNLLELCSGPSSSSTRNPNSSNLKRKKSIKLIYYSDRSIHFKHILKNYFNFKHIFNIEVNLLLENTFYVLCHTYYVKTQSSII